MFKEKIEEERLLVTWGYSKKKKQVYVKKPKKGIKFTDPSEGITEHRFKKNDSIKEEPEIDEAELEEFFNDKKKAANEENQIKK